jgi:DNA polymerase-3 subunit beta
MGLLLDAEDGVLRLSAFDYEVSARVEAPAAVGAPGRVLVSGRLLAEIVRSLPARPVDFTLDGSRLRVVCGSSKFTLLTMPIDDYPSLPVFPAGSGTVDGRLFAEAVGQVSIAASRDESPPMLAGVRVEIDGGDLTLMATDRYRLAVRTIPWQPADQGMQTAALVKAKTLTEVAKALGSGQITIGLDTSGHNGLIGFGAGGRRSTSLLMDGEYPRVRSLFPTESPLSARVDVNALAEAVKRVALVVERHTAVKLAFTDGTVTIEGGQGEDAQASEAVGCEFTGGDDIKIGFNPQYFLDALGSLTTPTANIAMAASGKPAVVTGIGSDGQPDPSFRMLLMPMRCG